MALSALLRERFGPLGDGREVASALQFGETAAAELAGMPDTPELRESDEARLAHDHPGAEETFESQLSRVVGQCSNDRQLDPAKASPAELLAAYVWSAASGGAAGGEVLG